MNWLWAFSVVYPIVLVFLYDIYEVNRHNDSIQALIRQMEGAFVSNKALEEEVRNLKLQIEERDAFIAALWADVNGYEVVRETYTSVDGVLKPNWGMVPPWNVSINTILGEFSRVERRR